MSDQINSRTERRKAQETANKQNKKPKKKNSIFKKVFMTLFIIGLAVLVGGGGLFAYYAVPLLN